MYSLRSLIFFMSILALPFTSNAEFRSKYKCVNGPKRCVEGKAARVIEGVRIERDCWKYEYIKSCDVPSKNDCITLEKRGCIINPEAPAAKCLAQDYGGCLNSSKHYVCYVEKEREEEEEELAVDPDDTGTEKLMKCTALLGDEDESKEEREDGYVGITQALSSLQIAMKSSAGITGNWTNGAMNEDIFKGNMLHCSRKMLNWSNCCNRKGWGRALGAGCSAGEKLLIEKRSKKLCLFAGERCSQKLLGTCIVKKYYFCCYGNKLEMAFNRWREDKSPGTLMREGCRGFTMAELGNVEMEEVNLKEFKTDILQRAEEKLKDYGPEKLKAKIDIRTPEIKLDEDISIAEHLEEKAEFKGISEEASKEVEGSNIETRFKLERQEKWKEKIKPAR